MFCICTIANNLTQYAEMRQSLSDAGFTEDRCRFLLFDNSAENAFEPYSIINRVLDEATEPYVIACHQDILLDQGVGFDQLIAQIDILNRQHPAWAIAGNCGGKSNLGEIYHLHDANGFHHAEPLPQRVQTLDENFLLIRCDSGVRCSAEVSGFHFYATDLCLNAARLGRSAFVIDFYFTHLSGGNVYSEDFLVSQYKFERYWDKKFHVCFVRTPCTFFYLSRHRTVRSLLARKPMMKLVRAGFKCLRLVQSFFGGSYHVKDSIKNTSKNSENKNKTCA